MMENKYLYVFLAREILSWFLEMAIFTGLRTLSSDLINKFLGNENLNASTFISRRHRSNMYPKNFFKTIDKSGEKAG